MTDPKLPELPPHKGWMNLHGEQSVQQVWGYTAAQMHAYARAAVELAGGGRDGERYRFIRKLAAGRPEAFGPVEDAAFAANYGDPDQFDFNIDAAILGGEHV